MSRPIRTVAVLGAGVMGAGVAAHLANAGCQVLLCDIVPPNLTEAEKADPSARNRFAAGGLEKALNEIVNNKGVLYDASVVEACMRVFGRGAFKFED